MSRRPYVAANWKMNKTASEADEFLDSFLPTQSADGAEVVLCPPWLALQRVAERCAGTPVKVCAQNMFYEDSGAFTGEVSAPMLLDVGVDGTILGHSERRQLFGETDEALARKIPKAIEAGLEPILCVGETQNERESGDTESVLSHQVLTDLAEIHTDDLEKVVIAYEPVWAIGTGLTASPDQAQDACEFIRNLLRSRDPKKAEGVRILYGGSVRPGNAGELLALPDIDGALVGGAALDPDDFGAIVAAAPVE
ncbi:MAG: triose-phosphate isomerase [Solirubrobacterales bacterium]|mgnify:CR=1 FL=1|nr:triose-phosphate isomerase [Solirubrobacterales bacterium]MCB0861066.1 triose-phosphate isomerase [Solirubrobacterales bacterium]HRV59744.1 triose-phosphate isomerase [Solirubrobacterales bacterium]